VPTQSHKDTGASESQYLTMVVPPVKKKHEINSILKICDISMN
jgi:hypothetical protein